MKRFLLSLTALAAVLPSFAQNSAVHQRSDGYVWPTDPLVLEKLDAWQDLKFGVLMHWGLYSVPGIVESWNCVTKTGSSGRKVPPMKDTSSGTGACPGSSIRWASTRSSGPTSSRTPA